MWLMSAFGTQHLTPNLTSLRLVLLMLLILAVHGIFLIEQPRGSEQVFPFHRRFHGFATTCAMWLGLHSTHFAIYRQDPIYIYIYIYIYHSDRNYNG